MNIFLKYKDHPNFKASYHDYFKRLEDAANSTGVLAYAPTTNTHRPLTSDLRPLPNPKSEIQNPKFPTLPSLFHPMIISKETLQALKQQSEQMGAILEKSVNLYLNDTEVQNFFNFPEPLHDWINIDPGYISEGIDISRDHIAELGSDNRIKSQRMDCPKHNLTIPISRYDGFWDGKLFQFCEFNTDGTSGMDEINTLDEAFLATDLGKEIQQKHNLKNFDLRKATLDILLKCYKEFGGKKEKPNIAIVDFMELATLPEFIALRSYFTKKGGYPTEICDIRKLELKKDGLYHNNFKIDLIYRRAVTDDMLPRKR